MILKNLHHLTSLSTQAISGNYVESKQGETGDKTEIVRRGFCELEVLVLSCQKLNELDLIPVIN